jgi:hypothetical protein
VRLLLDALGSKRIGRKFMAPMLAAGVQWRCSTTPRSAAACAR